MKRRLEQKTARKRWRCSTRPGRVWKRLARLTVVGIACALVVSAFGCSELGKRYITVDVDSNPKGATVSAVTKNKLMGGTVPVAEFGTTPTGEKGMHYAFGAPGVGDTRLGVRVKKRGFKDYEVFFTRDECYPSEEEADQNVKHIVAKLKPKIGRAGMLRPIPRSEVRRN